MEKFPRLSIVTCIYKGERIIEEYLKHLFCQDYPLNKIELILADGGNTNKTLGIIKKYEKKYPKIIKLIKNPKGVKVGRGNGADMASRKATGKIIVLLDQDNILIQKNWLRKMVEILINNPDIVGVQSRLRGPKIGNSVDRYLNYLGIEDPFVVDYSLNSQIAFSPQKFEYNSDGRFYIYEINKKEFYYAGDNGFIIWKDIFFETGGYTQDIDNFYRMALSKKRYKIAIPRDLRLHHKSSTSLKHLLSKKAFYVRYYLLQNFEDRCFYWFNLRKNNLRQNLRFVRTLLKNLSFFPESIRALKMYLKTKDDFWMIHPIAIWLITIKYITSTFSTIILKEQKESNI